MKPVLVFRLEHRLAAWEDELKTNRHKMQHLAERAIVVLKDELERLALKDGTDGS